MTDRNLGDQQKNSNLNPPDKELELSLINQNCEELCSFFNSYFNSNITCQEGFFLMFLGDNSGLDSRVLNYWKESRIFDYAFPFRELNLSTKAFVYIKSLPSNEIASMQLYLFDLIKGRYIISEKFEDENYRVIMPKYSNNSKLFSIIVKVKNFDSGFDILVDKMDNKDIKELVNLTLKGLGYNLGELNNFQNDDLKMQKPINSSNDKIKEEKELNPIDNIGEVKISNRSNKNSPSRNRKANHGRSSSYNLKRGKNIIIDAESFQKYIGNPYFKNSNQNRHYIETYDTYEMSWNINFKLSLNLLQLKSQINHNRNFYNKSLKLQDDDLIDWESFVLFYLEKRQNELVRLNIFSSLKLIWDIHIEQNLLDAFKDMNKLEFLLYLDKIIDFAQGKAIENFNEFSKINDRKNENFLIVPIRMEAKTNLKPIFAVFCVVKSNLTHNYEYQLKIVDFYNTKDLYKKKEEFRKSTDYYKIEKIEIKPRKHGLRDLVTIDEEIIRPNFRLNQVEVLNPIKKFFILCCFPKTSENLNFYFELEEKKKKNSIVKANQITKIIGKRRILDVTKEKLDIYRPNLNTERFNGEKKIIKKALNGLFEHLVKFTVNSLQNCNFSLKLQMSIGWGHENYKDVEIRRMNLLEYQFIFNVNFVNDLIDSQRIRNIKGLEDYYYQLQLFLDFCSETNENYLLECLIQSFLNLKLKRDSLIKNGKDKQVNIVKFVNLKYLEIIDEDNIEGLYFGLCILGLVKNFNDLNKALSIESLPRVLKVIEKHSDKYFKIFKVMNNFNKAMKGLAIVLSFVKLYLDDILKICSLQNKTIDEYFSSITDNEALEIVITEFLRMTKESQVYLSPKEVNFMLDKIKFFKKQKNVINLILKNNIPIMILANILLQQNSQIDEMPMEDKINIFSEALKLNRVCNKDMISLLSLIKDNENIFTFKLFRKKDILRLLKSHLNKKHNIKETDFLDIKQILIFIHDQDYLSRFSITNFLKGLILDFGYEKCIDLLLVVSDYLPKIVNSIILKGFITEYEFISKLNILLHKFPVNIQEISALYVFKNTSTVNLKFQIDHVAQINSLVIKKCYKEVYTKRFWDERTKNLNIETMNYLQKKFLTNSNNHIIFELLTGAPLLFSTSEEELMQKIIFKPDIKDFMFSYFKDNKKNKNQTHYSNIMTFLSNFEKSIFSRTIKINDFEAIINHSKKERSAFLKYLKYFTENSERFKDICKEILKIEKKTRAEISILKNQKIIECSPLSQFPEVNRVLQAYSQFLESKRFLNLENFILPDLILNFPNLKKFPLKSLIFKNCILRETSKSPNDYMKVLCSSYEILKTFLEGLVNLDQNKYSIEEIDTFFSCIDTHFMLNKEIKALTKGFSDMFNENSALGHTLSIIFEDICVFREYNELISSLAPSLEVLGLPKKYISDYLFSSTQSYNSEFSAKIKDIKVNFLQEFDKAALKSLTLFFKQIANSAKLIILMSEIKEHEQSMWCEFFEDFDNIEIDKKLNFNSIKNFSKTWLFLNKLKSFREDLISYLKNILNLMNEQQYLNITEIIFYCNLKVEAFEEFNSKLNTQEHFNLYKIKMIYKKSKIFVNRKRKFEPEITLDSVDPANIFGIFNSNDLAELRDRALLSKNIIEKKKDSSKFDRSKELIVYNKFLKFENTLCKYISVLNELNDTLYRKSLNNEYDFELENGNFKTLEDEYENKETGIYEQWNQSYKTATDQYYTINSLNGEMLQLIDEFIYDNSQDNLNKILWVLKCMHKEPPYALGIKVSTPDDIFERLENINIFFNVLIDSELSFKFPFEVINRKKEEDSILLSETEEFYRSVLSIYAIYQISLPYPELVLFCHYSTPWEEINRFLNRCTLNLKKLIHTIIYPEKLPLEIQIKIDSKLNSYYSEKKSYSLAIITNDSKSKLVSNLLFNPLVKIERTDSYMLDDDQISVIMNEFAPNFVVVTSNSVGLGKSEFIKSVAKSKNLPLFNINISATYDNISLLSKIKSTIKNFPALYKFNLNFLSDPEYFHELIFQLSVFKMVYSEKSIIMIPEESFIYIEVANSFENKLYKSVPFLNYLVKEEIKEFNLMNLIFTDRLIYVCNYLHLLKTKEINTKDLKFEIHSKVSLITDVNDYSTLLNEYFITQCGNSPNYHKLTTFLKVLSMLFQLLETSIFTAEAINIYKNDGLAINKEFYSSLRNCMINNIIKTITEFTTRCIDTTKSDQDDTEKVLSQEKTEIDEASRIDNTIKWENSNHFILNFSKEEFIAIYREPTLVPDDFKNLIVSQRKIYEILKGEKLDTEELEDYNKYESSELILKLLNFFYKVEIESNESKAEIVDRYLKEAEKTGYVLTPDNFLKMNLVYMRCISDLPLIIMGETGCGKTAMLRFFVENILREKLIIIYIHSEIKVSDIERYLKKANEKAHLLNNERVWVFFDEFNTSDCIGEITSIFCERKFEDLELHPNLVFIGACNPFRVKSGRNYKENVGIRKKISNESKLQAVHIVKPLSDKAFEFIWDFGSLNHNEIKVYVNSMLERVNIKNAEFFTKLICKAHEYFRDSEDCSSVSLRDVNRYTLLYEWFNKSIEDRKNRKIKKPLKEYTELLQIIEISEKEEELMPGILSLIHCYYLRIGSEKQRSEFLEFIFSQDTESDFNLIPELVENFIQFQELEFISRMTLPKEVALNQALMENIFAIIPCILCKIPIFICGKPGCSKSLAVNIVFSNLKGKKSDDEYFKILPEAQFIAIQGSESSTSHEIEEVFSKAEKLLDQNNDLLPIVLFDEIGLAESSKTNPLKVLHKLLEYENCKVGFIAISNWRLDASKMNRALYLARPDPEEIDLMKTAETLFSSYVQINNFGKYLPIIKDIAKGYYNMKQEYSLTDYPDFFGLRDFYHAIKYVAKTIIANPYTELNIIIKDSLYRNFDGLAHSIENLPLYFPMLLNINIDQKDPISLIQCNLKDPESRFLMILCEQDISEFIKSQLLSNDLGDHRFILGSTFEKDKVQEDSKFRILSDIIGYMEQGVSIIMENMDMVYSSLYDLFNQNYTYKGRNRRYCSAVLGSRYNPSCFVHNKFKAVVFLDNQESTLKLTEAPFLNRFEKHNLELNDIIREKRIKKLSQEIYEWVNQIVLIPGKKNRLSVTSVFPIFSKDIISMYLKYTQDSQADKCKEFLLDNASTDIVLLCQINGMSDQEKERIANKWKKLHNKSIEEYFIEATNRINYSEIEQRIKMISVIYDSAEIRFETIGKKVQKVKCSDLKCEEEFRSNYERFLMSKEKKLYLFELEYSKESHHLKFIISLIDSLDKNFQLKKKNIVKDVCILIRQKRLDENRKSLLLFKGWKYKMFENSVDSSTKVIQDLLNKDFSLLLSEEKYFNLKINIKEIAERSLETLLLKTDLFTYKDLKNFKVNVVEYISKHDKIFNEFKGKIIQSFKQFDESIKLKWKIELFTNDRLIYSADSIKGALRVFFNDKVLSEFTKIIFACEMKSGISSLMATKNSQIVFDIWVSIFERIETKTIIVNNKPESNRLNYFGAFKSPFFIDVYKILKKKHEELVERECADHKINDELLDVYNSESIWKEKSKLIFRNGELRENFIYDFTELTLLEKSVTERHTEYITQFVKANFVQNEFNLKALFDLKPKIISFNNLILIYQRYSIDKMEEFIEIPKSNNGFNQKLKSVLEKTINKFTEAKTNLENLGIYIKDICEVRNHIQCINPTIILENFDLLEFLVQLCELKKIELFASINQKIKESSFSNLFLSKNVEEIIHKISSDPYLDKDSTYKFNAYFLNKALQRNSEITTLAVELINKTEIWKYSGSLIEQIIDSSNLKSIIERIESKLQDLGTIYNDMNPLLKNIFDEFRKSDIKTTFCTLFLDKIKCMEISGVNSKKCGDVCKIYMDFIEKNSKDHDNLKFFIAIGRIQFYLNQFVKLIDPKNRNLGENEQDIIKSISSELKNRSLLVYELYCIKLLKGFNRISTFKLVEYLSENVYQWKINLREIRVQTKLLIFPIDDDVAHSDRYELLKANIIKIPDDINALDKLIFINHNNIGLLELGLAFINFVYLMNTTTEFNLRPYVVWFEQKEKNIINKLGKEFSSFLKILICNIPQNGLFYLTPSTETSRINIAMLISYTSLIAISYSSHSNQFSNQFFKSKGGIFPSLFEQSQQIYYIGAETPKIQDYLNMMKDNFEVMKNKTYNSVYRSAYSKGGSYVCSFTCDYFYIIDACGGQVELGQCPYCKSVIGGTNHKIYERPGHRNLTDDEARLFLKEKCSFYQSFDQKGFPNHYNNIPTSSIRKLKDKTTFFLLNFFTNSVFYFLYISGLYPMDQLCLVYNMEEDFKILIENNIIQNYSILNQDGEHFIFWMMETVNILRKLMFEFKGNPEEKEDRDGFEERFENKIKAQSVSEMVNNYKICLNTQTQPSKLVEYIDELNIPNEHIYNFSEFFRYSVNPSWNLFNRAYESLQKTEKLPLLDYYTQNYHILSNLEFLLPIISFSNEMISECSFEYSRAQSKTITMKELLESKEYLVVPFLRFVEAWNSLNIELRFGCKTFDKIQITEDTLIGYLLVDTDINSLGIRLAACIQTLCEIQNQVIEKLFEIRNQDNSECSSTINKSIIGLRLSAISKDDIFYINSESLNDLIKNNSINSFEYGKGEEIIYNYKQISDDIQYYLEKSKPFYIEKLETVQYQYELLHANSKYTGVILDIRSKIVQVALSDKDIQIIEKEIKLKSEYWNADIFDVWDQAYSWLGKAILYIRYSKFESKDKIENFDEVQLRVNHDFKVPEIFSRFIVGQVIDIYELVELKIFKIVTKSIDEQYKLEFIDKLATEQKLYQFLYSVCENYSNEMLFECQNVLKRIIIRLLTANTDPNHTIACYFVLETYWNFRYLENVDSVAMEFPDDITLDNAIEVNNYFDEILRG